MPLLFIAADLVMKLLALVIEDPDDRGDDFGIGILFVLLAMGWSIIYFRTRATSANGWSISGDMRRASVGYESGPIRRKAASLSRPDQS